VKKVIKLFFYDASYLILENDKIIYVGNRKGNVYQTKIDACMKIESCLVASNNDIFFDMED
jgi:hypothetical protein